MWTVPVIWRVATLSCSTLFVAAAAVPYDDSSFADTALLRVGFLALASAGGVQALRPRVWIAGDVLYFRDVFRTRSVPLSQVATIEPSRDGLSLWTSDGRYLQGPLLIGQRHEWYPRSHRTRGDAIASAITAAACATRGDREL